MKWWQMSKPRFDDVTNIATLKNKWSDLFKSVLHRVLLLRKFALVGRSRISPCIKKYKVFELEHFSGVQNVKELNNFNGDGVLF